MLESLAFVKRFLAVAIDRALQFNKTSHPKDFKFYETGKDVDARKILKRYSKNFGVLGTREDCRCLPRVCSFLNNCINRNTLGQRRSPRLDSAKRVRCTTASS